MGDFKKESNMILKKIAYKIEKSNLAYLFTAFFIIGFLIYFASLFNGFVWDDEEQILKNAIIQNITNLPYLFTSSTFNTGGAGLSGFYYKPLMPVSFSFINFIFGLNPFFYHFFDLIIHFANVCLLFLFFKKIFDHFKYKFSKTISFFLSLIFLVHPANVESVAYISSTQELLYVFFLLLTLLISFKFLIDKKLNWKYLAFLSFFSLCSLLSKESGIIVIPILITIAFLINRSRIKAIIFSSFFVLLFYLLLRFPIAKTPLFQHSSIIPIANALLLERLLTVPFELFSYLRLIFFPLNLFVAQHFVVQSLFDVRFYLTLPFLLIFCVIFLFISRKFKSKSFLFFSLWLAFSFFLLLNIYPLDMTVAERWLYGPLIGVLGLTGAIFLKGIEKNIRYLQFFVLFSLLATVFFSIRSFNRTFNWNSNLSLFSHDINFVPDSFDAQNNLGVALFNQGNMQKAKEHFKNSIKLSPNWWTPYNNLGVIYQRQGKLKEAKDLYQKSIDKGNYYLAYENLAKLKAATENPKQVLPFLESSLRTLPNNEVLNKTAAYLYFKTGDVPKAKFYATRTYQIRQTQENYILLQSILNPKK